MFIESLFVIAPGWKSCKSPLAEDGYMRCGINSCLNEGSRRERRQPKEWEGGSHRPGAWIRWGRKEKDSRGTPKFLA